MRTKSAAEEAWSEAYCPVRGEPGDRKLNIKAHMFGVSAVVITPPQLHELSDALQSVRVRLSDDQFDEVMDIYEKVANPPQSPQLYWVDGGKFLRELETYVEDDCKGIAQAEMPDELTLDLQAPARLFSTAHARNYDRKELDRERYKTVKLQDFVAVDPPPGDVNEKPFWIGRVMKINRTAQTAQVKWWWSRGKDPYTSKYKPWTGADNAAAEITPNNIIFHWPNLTPKGEDWEKGSQLKSNGD